MHPCFRSHKSSAFTRSAICLIGTMALSSLIHQTAHAELLALRDTPPGGLYRISETTGEATFLSNLTGNVVTTAFSGLDYRPIDGKLYASNIEGISSNGGNAYQFGSIDLNTYQFTPLNLQGNNNNWQGLAYNQNLDVFYVSEIDSRTMTDNLILVTPSGSFSYIGRLSNSSTGLAYDPHTDTLYGANATNLFRINTLTGAMTVIGRHGVVNGGNVGLAWDNDNQILYMNVGRSISNPSNPNAYSLFQLDTATAAATLVGNNGLDPGLLGYTALAWKSSGVAATAPEPSSLGLLLLAPLFIRRWIRRSTC